MKNNYSAMAIILILGSVTFAADLPKSLPHLKVKQEKVTKSLNTSNAKVVVPLYALNTENRSLAGSEQIVLVSDPLFEMKTQKFGD